MLIRTFNAHSSFNSNNLFMLYKMFSGMTDIKLNY